MCIYSSIKLCLPGTSKISAKGEDSLVEDDLLKIIRKRIFVCLMFTSDLCISDQDRINKLTPSSSIEGVLYYISGIFQMHKISELLTITLYIRENRVYNKLVEQNR